MKSSLAFNLLGGALLLISVAAKIGEPPANPGGSATLVATPLAAALAGMNFQIERKDDALLARRGECALSMRIVSALDAAASARIQAARSQDLRTAYLYRQNVLARRPVFRPAIEQLASRSLGLLGMAYRPPAVVETMSRACPFPLLPAMARLASLGRPEPPRG